MTAEVAKAINNVSKRLNEVQNQVCELTRLLAEQNSSDIDYVAMMTDVDIPDKTEDVNEEVSE